MDTLYWISEYGKVFCAYLFFMFIWPSVVFSAHLKNKGKTYRFSFCVTVQIVIVNTVVLVLGLFHILDQRVVIAIFYGVFLVSVLKKTKFRRSIIKKDKFEQAATEAEEIKLLLQQGIKKIEGWIKKGTSRIRGIDGWLCVEYIILSAVIIYGMIYFSYGAFQDYNYGFGDMYVHHKWINGLMEGNIFCDGVYPAAMHCFIYCMHVLSGINVYSFMLFLGGIHVSILLLSVYIFLKEIFEWKYTPIFVLILFLILDCKAVSSIARLQWTIPQEFGLFTQFLCALYLIYYLKSSDTITVKNKTCKFYWNENLLIFMMALAASIATHFYDTIMAFLLCISIAVFAIKRVLKKERFIPLVAAALCGFLIAVLPMTGALAVGIPFQGSINWAVGVINGENLEPEEEMENTEINIEQGKGLRNKLSVLYRRGYVALYREKGARWIVGLTGFTMILWCIYRLISIVYPFLLEKTFGKKYFNGYMPIITASIIYMIAYTARRLGMPQLISGIRLCSSEQILLLAGIIMPIDMIFTFLSKICINYILYSISMLTIAGIYCVTVISGNYRGYLYCELTRYNAAIEITDSIMKEFPLNSYTIISTTDELYQVIQQGRHEELLRFCQEIGESDYKLPTEYVFLYIEKRPIEYAQYHYFHGPKWLAEEKYADSNNPHVSQCPEINASNISEEEAQKDILLYERPSLSYTKLESRTILESKAYLWCQNFMKLYPSEMSVYYEDENFVCYYFKQDPQEPYNLAIEEWDQTDGIKW